MDRSLSDTVLKVTAPAIVADPWTVIPSGAVVVFDGKVQMIDVSENLKGVKADRTIRLKDHVLHPGFVNAHCHLELSYMKGKLTPKAPFIQWVRQLRDLRGNTGTREMRSMAAGGIKELKRTGTTCVGDVGQTRFMAPLLAGSGLKGVFFHETLGFDPSMAQERLDDLIDRVEQPGGQDGLFRQGVAPHAVYSTSLELLALTASYASKGSRPLSMHMAETPEETLFSSKGKGPFKDLLKFFGIEGKHPGKRPLAAAGSAGALRGCLLIHFNHPSPGDIALLKKEGAKVVFCPNSNLWFGRKVDHPLPKLLKLGIPAGLGTDSLASNGMLDMRAEMRSAVRLFPELGHERILSMATRGGAEALDYQDGTGTLHVGAPFDAAALPLKSMRQGNMIRSIIQSKVEYSRLWVGGRPVRI